MTNEKKEAPLAEVPKKIIPQEKNIASFNAEAIISQAVSQNVSVETMERLLVMRRELKAEFAKEAYDKAMAEFQAECPTIQKTKEVKTKSGMVAYRYAPIESIVDQVKTVLQKHGFSYSSNMELIENGTTKVKASIKVTHSLGHSEITDMTVPLGNKTDIMSQSQVVAAAQTFAKRYAFCNAFGILTGDEDTDAVAIDKEEIMPQYTHDGNIVEKPQQTKDIPASEKQLKFIADLMRQKGYTKEDIIDQGFGKLTGGKEGTASELIDFLFKAKTKISLNGQELPVIQQEMSEEDQKLVDGIPF